MSSTAETAPADHILPAVEAHLATPNGHQDGNVAPAHHTNDPEATVGTSQVTTSESAHAQTVEVRNESAPSVNAELTDVARQGAGSEASAAPPSPSPPTAVAVASVPPPDNASPQDASTPLVSASEPQVADSATNESATYGTRSRNRGGNARPNYAEDQDMDFEYSAPSKDSTLKKGQPANATPSNQNTDSKRAQDLQKLIGVDSNGSISATASPGSKEQQIPGTSSFSAVPSKKRKAITTSTANATTAAVVSSNGMPPVRRSGLPPASATARETNILSFTKHKSTLNKRGELIADDGTKLAVNGKSSL